MQMQVFYEKNSNISYLKKIFLTLSFLLFQFPFLLNVGEEVLLSFTMATSYHFYHYFAKLYARHILKLASGTS
jgi:hypothetical protein